jgi:flagella basal body P-ring formation protein FlgA
MPLAAPALHSGEPRAAGVVEIQLRREARISEPVVTIGDIAELRGGPAGLRDRIAQLDLTELTPETALEAVTGTRVAARLLLTGIPRESFIITGPQACTAILQTPGERPRERVLSVIRETAAARLNREPEQVIVELAQPLPPSFWAATEHPGVEFDARLAATQGPGRARIELWVIAPGRKTVVTPAQVEIGLREQVVVAAHSLTTGQRLEPEHVLVEERIITQRQDRLGLDAVAGRTLCRPIAAGDVIHARDLSAVATAAPEPPLVQPRDIVRLTARKGNLTIVVPAAEALQAGHRGDLIRVRNSSSGRIVIGRVLSAGEVEVPL